MSARGRARGVTLIEAVVFVMVLGIGLLGILTLYHRVTTASVDPVVRKQALALAASLLEEIQLRGFTFCDPDDPAVYTALAVADCATQEGMGPEGGETRHGVPRFDNVSDYHGFSMSGASIRTADNTPVAGLDAYSVAAAVRTLNAGELPGIGPLSDGLHITVSATGPAGVNVVLEGYRLRYAPNSP